MREINEELLSLLKAHEGFRSHLYKCPSDKWTIGYGWNLEDRGIKEPEAEVMLRFHAQECVDDLKAAFPWYDNLTERRKHALIDMCFNMGIGRLKGFRKMLSALENGQWQAAKNHALDSTWAKQVGGRAVKVAGMFL